MNYGLSALVIAAPTLLLALGLWIVHVVRDRQAGRPELLWSEMQPRGIYRVTMVSPERELEFVDEYLGTHGASTVFRNRNVNRNINDQVSVTLIQ